MKLVSRIAVDIGSEKIRAVAGSESADIFSDHTLLARRVVTGEIVAIGEEAEDYVLAPGEELVHPIKHGVMVDYDATVALLKHILHRTLSWWHVFKPRVVVAESLELSGAISQAMGEAVQAAGGGKVYMSSVPSLAALGAGINSRESTGNFVLDIGHGTTEAAIVSRGSTVSAFSAPIGGSDLIDSLVNYLEDAYAVNVSRSAAADIIHDAGSALRRDNDIEYEFYANEIETGEAKILSITGNEVADVIAKTLQRIVGVASTVIRTTPTTLLSDIAQNGIVLTGGVANLNHLDTFLKRELALPIRVMETPENAVITGGRSALPFISVYEQSVTKKSG